MTILEAILQGLIQGFTEFLPVSSSGHLSLFQYFTGSSSDSSVTFSVMLHFGTLIAVFIAFWPIWPAGNELEEWNLALELSRTALPGWRELVEATGFSGARAGALPHIVIQGLWMKLAGSSLAACQGASAVLGGFSCLLTALLGEKLFSSRRVGVLAGALLAFCPTALFASALLTW